MFSKIHTSARSFRMPPVQRSCRLARQSVTTSLKATLMFSSCATPILVRCQWQSLDVTRTRKGTRRGFGTQSKRTTTHVTIGLDVKVAFALIKGHSTQKNKTCTDAKMILAPLNESYWPSVPIGFK